ncbi:NADPH-dependent F420 reductase [Pelagibacterium halotolerans]|uniref:NADPH-dependent F420 reductase n=1 Tax=Pelagibacterium halotolerans TaxID=531813 RepID=UPI00384F765B
MTTAIIGLGNMGKGLARRLAGKTDLVVAARNTETASALANALPNTRAASVEDAIAQSEIVVIATHYGDARDLAAGAALDGKILVDITNPIKPDFSGLLFGHSTSAAEEIQAAASGARVVKAFNTIFAQLFDIPAVATADVPVYIAGDDEEAVKAVADLVRKAGFAPESAGGLDAARLLEPLGMLNIRFGYGLGRGTAIAPNWLSIAA